MPSPPPVDYYAVLNLPKTCTPLEIKKSYQKLALTFHPDKTSPSLTDQAQVEFEKVKRAHAVLSDVASRKAYDAFGDKGVRMLEEDPAGAKALRKYSQNPNLLLEALHEKAGTSYIRRLEKSVQTRGSVVVHSTLVPTFTTGSSPKTTKISINQTVTSPLNSSTSLSFGGHVVSNYGLAHSEATIGIDKKLKNNTSISSSISTGTDQKLTIDTTRSFDLSGRSGARLSGFFSTTSRGATLQSWKTFTPSLTANCTLGMHKVGMTVFRVSGTKYFEGGGVLTGDVGMQPGEIYVQGTGVRDFGEGTQRVKSKIKLGTRGTSFLISSSRRISKFTLFAIGLKIDVHNGVYWIIKLTRGNMSFECPVVFSTFVNPSLTIFAGSLGMLVDELVVWCLNYGKPSDKISEEKLEDEILSQNGKNKQAAESQQQLMMAAANKKGKEEGEKMGLVIREAVYREKNDNEGFDVKIPLQFFVKDSEVRLPDGNKNSVLGFFREEKRVVRIGRGGRGLFSLFSDQGDDREEDEEFFSSPVRSTDEEYVIYARYSFGDGVFEVEIDDGEEFVLPSEKATRMGDLGSVV